MLRVLAIVGGLLLAIAVGAESVSEFVRRHWAAPLRPQGPPPKGWSALEASLQPRDCWTCHPVQYGDWRTSVHAAAMGPGVAGQLAEMAVTDPVAALECPVCHAPLAEQSATVRTRDPSLRAQGVVCAS